MVTVTDTGSGATFKLVKYYSNDDDHDGDDDDDRDHNYNDMTGWTLKAGTSGSIRADRDSRHPRVYTLKYKATDLAGNYAYCYVSVTVPREQGTSHDKDNDERDHDSHYCDDKGHQHKR